ncbi:helix-turn-helix transcriptional regulator [Gilvimarinus sp. 1_MG-2023]|uniref:helix-turn-helix transcriptional regulator n=1 Tax=Gilvimarinus sp. 1_MG-2023 TaxID=3062638 RepID=UPI0026E1C8DE|nr:WYL domain-containing protein [Gilvimarinus sp. 1_MG-2023]MDO6748451.1 WYL domain-containing protein [Gilvimarinus sp. 1_MG-2023]
MDISDAQKARLHIFELVVYWEGAANSSLLVKHFGLSRQQASQDIKRYTALMPGNLNYCNSRKCHQPSSNFKPLFITGEAEQYLAWLSQPLPLQTLPIHSLSLPSRGLEPALMRAIAQAIRHHQRLEVDYVSLTNPNRRGRVIAPHSLVQTGLRWHLRAWCEHKKQFRDFVLSRFRGDVTLSGPATHSAGQDTAWNTEVELIFEPDLRLTLDKRSVIEHDYQMHNGQLRIKTRACLVQYLLQEMRVNTKVLDAVPEAQQIILVNLNDIKQWLF